MFEVVDREGLVDRAREVGGRLADAFRGLSDQLPLKAVRGKGLFVGLELDDEFPRTAPELARTALDLGLHIGSAGDRVLRIAPPLNVTEDELDRGLDLVVEVLKS
jgi:4-aminobutyrate aminotransferase-like enzyme